MYGDELVAAFRAQQHTIERLSGIAIAHQLMLARMLIGRSKDAATTDQIEEAFLGDVSAAKLGDTDDVAKMEVRRWARGEVLDIMTLVRDGLGHPRRS
ncbi:MAG: hypothetical protein KDK97_05520 [Verrucomicrobiales bacterium]|nr:hypothetical protein [Verrucomicrobiales bacterium]